MCGNQVFIDPRPPAPQLRAGPLPGNALLKRPVLASNREYATLPTDVQDIMGYALFLAQGRFHSNRLAPQRPDSFDHLVAT